MKKVLIDIGSNKLQGYRKLVDILGVDDSWEKVFVEPNPENYDSIMQQLPTIPNSIFYPSAVNQTGAPVILITRADVSGDIAATIRGKKYLDNVLAKFDMKADGYNEYEVSGITINEILNNYKECDIYIKLDCEGMEFEILHGIDKSFFKSIKRLFVEFHGNKSPATTKAYYAANGITLEYWE